MASDPFCLVIFGASGDLTSRRLLPALYHLHSRKALPDRFCLVGTGRTALSDREFRGRMREAAAAAGMPLDRWEGFAPLLSWCRSDEADPSGFQRLASHLAAKDRESGSGGNLLFYLAVPALLYPKIAAGLAAAGLAANRGPGWPRIVVEKPFGSDLASAIALDLALHQAFSEERIYRIDHYLARETVQNVLVLRFANAIFEPVWNRGFVSRVEILAAESLGVEGRGATYDRSGVMRDMFQNHMMQLLAMVGMEPPPEFLPGPVQDEKARLFAALRPFPVGDIPGNLVFGQYQGYRAEPGVRPDSPIPTFARLKVLIDNPRWKGVPFFLTSGKKMREKRTEIAVHFREVAHPLFGEHGGALPANRLTLGIHPREGVSLRFLTKEPGVGPGPRPAELAFDYAQGAEGPLLPPYEKALLDVMAGDHMLFWRQDGVRLTWAWLDPILEACERCVPSPRLHPYQPGSEGPEEAKGLL